MDLKNFREFANKHEFLSFGILLPIIIGAIVFLVSWLTHHVVPTALFWGVFAAYLIFGAFFSFERSKNEMFDKVNAVIGLIIFFVGVFGLLLWPEIKLLGWPTIAAGTTICFLGSCGVISRFLGESLIALDEYNYY
jgi:FtsH-binding integral membrane protein